MIETRKMPEMRIGDLRVALPIVQGGMGVGISLSGLASTVAEEGCVGVISAAGVGRLEPDFRKDLAAADERALRGQIRRARELSRGVLGVNLMMALSDFESLFRVSVEEGVDMAFIGAGLLVRMPSSVSLEELQRSGTKIIPKVSSAKAARVIFSSWDRHYGRIPDAVVVEGPAAGGHLGFSREQLEGDPPGLEEILAETLTAMSVFEERYGRKIPVIAAGGIFTGKDIRCIMDQGAAGVKMGTRFVATRECDAHPAFKQAYVDCRPEDLVIIDSPVGLPGRAIRSPLLDAVARGESRPLGCFWQCLRSCDVGKAPYCIARALMRAREGDLREGFAFAGANAHRVTGIVSVRELVAQLVAEFGMSLGERCAVAAGAI